MTKREVLHGLVDAMPENRLQELLDHATKIDADMLRDEWQQAGLRHLANCYGDDEPEYTEADLIEDDE